VQRTLKALDSAHFPAALPGIQPGAGFVFADMLGFHAVAMTRDGTASLSRRRLSH
jgi:DNA phosphorothioation-dependent restriction protein DptH